VLTVADSGLTAGPTPVIAFVLEGDRVRFAVDMGEAGRAGLKISDQLLKLAIDIKRAP
jgi:hypothetical protein